MWMYACPFPATHVQAQREQCMLSWPSEMQSSVLVSRSQTADWGKRSGYARLAVFLQSLDCDLLYAVFVCKH